MHIYIYIHMYTQVLPWLYISGVEPYIYIHTYIYIYVYTYIYIFLYSYIYTHVRRFCCGSISAGWSPIYVHTYIHTYVDTHRYIHIYIYTHTYTQVLPWLYISRVEPCIYVRALYICMYTHIHIYIYSYIHIYIHTHIRRFSPWLLISGVETYTCVYTYTYIDIFMYTYIYTYVYVGFAVALYQRGGASTGLQGAVRFEHDPCPFHNRCIVLHSVAVCCCSVLQ